MAVTALQELGRDGEFKRTDAGFRNWIEEGGKYPPEGELLCLLQTLQAMAFEVLSC